MNVIFLCGVVKDFPVIRDSGEANEGMVNIILPNSAGESISEISCRSRDETIIKRLSKVKPYDLVFLSGTMTDIEVIISDFSIMSKFSSKEKALRKLLEFNVINKGLVCGEVVGWNKEASTVSVAIKRDNSIYYGDLKEKDVLQIQTKNEFTLGLFVTFRVRIEKNKIIQAE